MLVIYFHGNGLHQGLKISLLKEKQSLVVQSTKEYSKSNERMTIRRENSLAWLEVKTFEQRVSPVCIFSQRAISLA